MPAPPAVTAEEWFDRMRNAPPPTEDDVTVLLDGRRLDSREKVLVWLAEVEAERGNAQRPTPMSIPDGRPHDLRRLIEALDRHDVEYLRSRRSGCGRLWRDEADARR